MADRDAAFDQQLGRLVEACEAGVDLAGVLAAAADAVTASLGADATATYELSEDGAALLRVAGEGPDELEVPTLEPLITDGRALLPLVSAGRVLGCIVAAGVSAPEGLPRARIAAGIAAQAAEASRLWSGVAAGAGTVDRLTALPNHLGFQGVLARELSRAKRTGSSVAVSVIDVGGTAGLAVAEAERIVRDAAACLSAGVRSYDCACRLDADRFALVLPGMEADAAAALVGRLSHSVAERAASDAVTVTAGVSAFPEHAAGTDELARLAVAALDDAASGSGVAVWRPGREPVGGAVRSDDAARGHSETSRATSEYAGHIAGTLGLPAERVERIRLAAFLYDATAPADGERARMAGRVTAGMLDEEAAEWLLARGRGVAEAPLETRIMAVAEAFVTAGGRDSDAAAGAALAELWSRAGDDLDARCVRALERLLAPPADG